MTHLVALSPSQSDVATEPAQNMVDAGVLGHVLSPNMMLFVCVALAALAMFALIRSSIAQRETAFAENVAKERSMQFGELSRTFDTAEAIAGLGVWQYDPSSGTQIWSVGMRRLFGVDHSDPFVEGDAETLLFANDVDLIGGVGRYKDYTTPYNLSFEIFGYDGMARSISVTALNLREDGGRLARVVAVLRDNSDQVERVRQLESSRAVAVQAASKARELAETDPLTGLSNRRKLMDQLDRMLVDARISEKPLVLIVFDIDHFKSVNDTYGHAEGDRVLQKVAQIALDQARDGDALGRVGGEEFVWAVPGAGKTAARVMAERLRNAIASGSKTETCPAVTVSVGFASLIGPDTSLSLFARADDALYNAKNAGRNRVRMAA